MSSRPGKSTWKSRIVIGLAMMFLLALGIGGLALRAIHERPQWREVARRLVSRNDRVREVARALYYKAAGAKRVVVAALPAERADAPLVIYEDALGAGWQDWSWITHDLQATGSVHSGSHALSILPEAWKGLYLHHDGFDPSGYGALELFVRGSPPLQVAIADGNGKFGTAAPLGKYLSPDTSNGWAVARIPLADLGVSRSSTRITGVVFQATESRQTDVVLDDIRLLPDTSLPAAAAHATVAVTVGVTAGRHAISPYIYGMAFAPPDFVKDLRLGSNRWGGNDKSRYNWVHGNASNAARDWRWANRPASDSSLPPGPSSAADLFVRNNHKGGAATVLTIPMIGWVAKNADTNVTSKNVPDQGGAAITDNGAISGYEPTANRLRTSVRSAASKDRESAVARTGGGDIIYQDAWVRHLVRTFGTAAQGGVRFYAMDNEPDLWDQTHTDVHPARMGYDNMLSLFAEYATAVKAVDPTALVTGPVSWGWTGYLYSALDRGDDNFATHADRKRHGDEPFLLWFLKQLRSHDTRIGRRTLDVLDVHFYPQGAEIFSPKTDKDTNARRLRSTRSLWDSAYTDESWIGEPIRLIPRLKEWIAAGYPGTKIGITEWNFGADHDMNGALAIAEALSVFGREGVFLANYWAFPPKNSPGYLAFKLFRNADSRGHGFGDVSCQATSTNPDQVSCFASTDTRTNSLTLLLINKMPKTRASVPITFHGAQITAASTSKMWRLSADNPGRIVMEAGPNIQNKTATLSLPPYSITLVRLGDVGSQK